MAQTEIVLALDSGALIAAEKDPRVEAILRLWLSRGARIIVPAPVLAEGLRGTAKDAAANRLIAAIGNVPSTTEAVARDAGKRLAGTSPPPTIVALIVATAVASGATDILTTDERDMRRLLHEPVNVIGL